MTKPRLIADSANTNSIDGDRLENGSVAGAKISNDLPSSKVVFQQDSLDATPRSVESKLQESVSVLDFGADPSGNSDSSTQIKKALNSGATRVIFPPGTYRILSSCVVTSLSLKHIIGYGSTIEVELPTSVLSYAIDAGTNNLPVQIEGLNFQATELNGTQTESWYGGTYTYQYRANNGGAFLPQGSTVNSCSFKNLGDAIYISGSSLFPLNKPTKVTNCLFQENLVSFTGYLCSNLEFSGNTGYLGSEVTFPSCRNLLITNNSLFLPGTPGINVGGSGAVQGESVTISNNFSFSRDPIVIEEGFQNVIITGNQCFTMSDSPNGVGIGVTTTSNGQPISRVLISNNRISRYQDPYGSGQPAFGIRLNATAAVQISDVQIESNQIAAVGNGIDINGNFAGGVLGLSIRNNTIRSVRANGIVVNNCDQVVISNNTLLSDTTVAASRGILVGNTSNATIESNITTSFVTSHYFFSGTQSSVLLKSPKHNAPTEARLWEFSSVSGNLSCLDVVFTGGGPTTLGSWTQGSSTLNPIPSSGAYIGHVCVSSGSPGTWKAYGQILA